MGEFKAGKINKYILSSDILERDITLSIYLPEDFTELFKSQVIICFDGLDFFRFGRIQREYERLRKRNILNVLLLLDFIMKMLRNVEKSFILKVVVVKRRFSQ